MITLGIETSGQQGSVALMRVGELLGERDLSREGRRHARTLIPEIRDLLKDTSLSPADIETIAVSIGPGSFTGLRVGVTCAKTWAYATGASVVAVDTFRAVAHQISTATRQASIISDAQRGDLFVGRFERRSAADWNRMGEIEIVPAKDWIASLRTEDVVSGPGVSKLLDQLSGRCRLEELPNRLPAARTIASLGERLALDGRSDDHWTLEPLYLRRSAAEEKADACAQS